MRRSSRFVPQLWIHAFAGMTNVRLDDDTEVVQTTRPRLQKYTIDTFATSTRHVRCLDTWQIHIVARCRLPDPDTRRHISDPIALRRIIVKVVHLMRIIVEVV